MKNYPNKEVGKKNKGRGTAKKHVLGAPCKLKMVISFGRVTKTSSGS